MLKSKLLLGLFLLTNASLLQASGYMNYGPGVSYFVVPTGVTSVVIDAWGGGGGGGGACYGGFGGAGGTAADNVGTFTVTPGQVLTVTAQYGGRGGCGGGGGGAGGGSSVFTADGMYLVGISGGYGGNGTGGGCFGGCGGPGGNGAVYISW